MMDKQSAFMDNLRQLFAECDTDQSGSLGRGEFAELCKRIGLSSEAANETFERLDIDKNGQISFDEFVAGFQQYSRQSGEGAPARPVPPAQPALLSPGARTRARTSPGAPGRATPSTGSSSAASALTSSQSFLAHAGSPAAEPASFESARPTTPSDNQSDSLVVYSGDLIGEQTACGSGQFGSLLSNSSSTACSQVKTMQDLLDCVQKLQNENQMITQIFFKDKREREEYISQLGEEFDQQLREVEERANRRAREELENEKKRLREMMQVEREQLEQHYQTLEKASKLVRSPGGVLANGAGAENGESIETVKSRLEDTFVENRQLKRSLLDTKTDVALIWKEMEKLKIQYEDKLSSAYEKHRETQHECDHIKQQLSLMKDSNRRLQDASDVISNYITDRVEPVIKVASGCNLADYDEGAPHEHQLNGVLRAGSANNSRRGSILSEYLQPAEPDDNDCNVKNNSNKDEAPSGAAERATFAAPASPHKAVSLQVPTVSAPAPLTRTRSDSERTDASNTDEKKQLASSGPLTLLDTKPADAGAASSKQREAGSALKMLRRNLLLGARAQSEPKSGNGQQLAASNKLEEQESSAEHSDEPLVEPADGPSKATFTVILVGDSYVGKSSFATRFTEGSFVQGLISSCSMDIKTKSYKVDGQNYTINLWDTAGQERFRSLTASYFRKANGIILMYDVTDKSSYLNVRNWMSTIADQAAENVAVLLVGNKIDLRNDENQSQCVPKEEGHRLAQEYDIVFLETSVKTGTNLLPSMGRLIRLLAKNADAQEEDVDRIRLGDKKRTFNCMPKNC